MLPAKAALILLGGCLPSAEALGYFQTSANADEIYARPHGRATAPPAWNMLAKKPANAQPSKLA